MIFMHHQNLHHSHHMCDGHPNFHLHSLALIGRITYLGGSKWEMRLQKRCKEKMINDRFIFWYIMYWTPAVQITRNAFYPDGVSVSILRWSAIASFFLSNFGSKKYLLEILSLSLVGCTKILWNFVKTLTNGNDLFLLWIAAREGCISRSKHHTSF